MPSHIRLCFVINYSRPYPTQAMLINWIPMAIWKVKRLSSHIGALYQMHTIADCACAGNAGNVFTTTDFKGNRLLAIPACITERTSRTYRDACRGR